jgi:hypothetical protein
MDRDPTGNRTPVSGVIDPCNMAFAQNIPDASTDRRRTGIFQAGRINARDIINMSGQKQVVPLNGRTR